MIKRRGWQHWWLRRPGLVGAIAWLPRIRVSLALFLIHHPHDYPVVDYPVGLRCTLVRRLVQNIRGSADEVVAEPWLAQLSAAIAALFVRSRCSRGVARAFIDVYRRFPEMNGIEIIAIHAAFQPWLRFWLKRLELPGVGTFLRSHHLRTDHYGSSGLQDPRTPLIAELMAILCFQDPEEFLRCCFGESRYQSHLRWAARMLECIRPLPPFPREGFVARALLAPHLPVPEQRALHSILRRVAPAEHALLEQMQHAV